MTWVSANEKTDLQRAWWCWMCDPQEKVKEFIENHPKKNNNKTMIINMPI